MERKTRNDHQQTEGRWGVCEGGWHRGLQGLGRTGSLALSTHSPSRTFSSLWPTYMLMSSGPFTLRERMGRVTLL